MAGDAKGRKVRMYRPDLENIPRFEVPDGYSLRRYRRGDEGNWTRIQTRADEYNTTTAEKFDQQFGPDHEALALRQYYLCDASGRAIGTATAWADSPQVGRVHWVAIVPEFQGRSLSKPMLAAVCNRLRELGHVRAVLGTYTLRVAAIGLYLKFGFLPEISGPEDAAAWREMGDRLSEGPLAGMNLSPG